jgi:putative flippase GtrA
MRIGRESVVQMLRFAVATGISAVVSVSFPVILHELLHLEQKLAVGISQASVLLLNFLTLRLFVFRANGGGQRVMFRYLASAFAFRGLEYLSFLLLFELADLFYLTALVITLVAWTGIKFAWYRYLFGDRVAAVG